jgi:hypothetical protein
VVTQGIPPATLAFYEDHQTPYPTSVEEWSWADIVEAFSEYQITECAPCPGGQRCEAKKRNGAFSPAPPRESHARGNVNTDFVYLLVFDFDHLTADELEHAYARLDGLERMLYSTHSHLHGGPDDNCVRVILPLLRPLAPDEFTVVHREVRKRYGLEWFREGASKPTGADPAAKDVSRLYFLPTSPVGAETLTGYDSGGLIDVNALLRDANFSPAPSRPRVAVGDSMPKPPGSFPPIDMDGLRKRLRDYNPKHKERDDDKAIPRKELIRRMLDNEPLVKPEEGRIRDDSCHRLGSILAEVIFDASEEAIIQLTRMSLAGLPTYNDDGPEDTFDARSAKVVSSWQRGLAARESRLAQLEAERAAARVTYEKFRARFKIRQGKTENENPSSESVDETDEEENPIPKIDFEGWETQLLMKELKNGDEVLENLDANAHLILTAAPEWRGVLRFNELTKNVEVNGGPLQEFENDPEQVTSGIKYWLQEEWGLRLSTNDVMDAIRHTAKAFKYNPLQDYLNGRAWDGVPRIDNFLEHYCGAATADTDGTDDISKYVRTVSRRWFVGAAARGLQPGCKLDTVLILEGLTGIKKSSLFENLAGEFFSDSKLVIGERDAMMAAGFNWIYEIAELAAFHASETETQKAFFSSRIDRYRVPYGRTFSACRRMAVFVGSTNEDRYLNDLTGNRRYWPVRCTSIKLGAVREDRDQLWAEAVAIYKAGFDCPDCDVRREDEDRCPEHRWWMSPSEYHELLEGVTNKRLKNDYAEAISTAISRIPVAQRSEWYTVFDIATSLLNLTADRVPSQQVAIGRALKSLGFEKCRRREGGNVLWAHITPEALLKGPQYVARVRHLTVVPDEPKTNGNGGVH